MRCVVRDGRCRTLGSAELHPLLRMVGHGSEVGYLTNGSCQPLSLGKKAVPVVGSLIRAGTNPVDLPDRKAENWNHRVIRRSADACRGIHEVFYDRGQVTGGTADPVASRCPCAPTQWRVPPHPTASRQRDYRDRNPSSNGIGYGRETPAD